MSAEPRGIEATIEFIEVGLAMLADPEVWANPINPTAQRDPLLRTVQWQFQSYLAAGAPHEVTASISAPKNLWAYIKKALGFRRYKTERRESTEIAYARVCPHLTKPPQDHVRFLTWGET